MYTTRNNTRIAAQIIKVLNKKGLFYTVGRVRGVGDDGYLEIDHERDTPPVCGVSDSITPMPFLIE